MNEKEVLDLLREAHREPIAEAHYAAVRARVMSRLAEERRPWRGWIWAYGLAGVAVLAALVGRAPWLLRSPSARGAERSSSFSALAQSPAGGPAAEGVRPTLAPTLARHGRAINPAVGARLARTAVGASYGVVGPRVVQPLVVKMVTDDPNIVIYWISGE